MLTAAPPQRNKQPGSAPRRAPRPRGNGGRQDQPASPAQAWPGGERLIWLFSWGGSCDKLRFPPDGGRGGAKNDGVWGEAPQRGGLGGGHPPGSPLGAGGGMWGSGGEPPAGGVWGEAPPHALPAWCSEIYPQSTGGRGPLALVPVPICGKFQFCGGVGSRAPCFQPPERRFSLDNLARVRYNKHS